MTTIEYIPETRKFSDEIRQLLVATNHEFVPPLSAREGTTQRDGLSRQSESDTENLNEAIEDYLNQCLDQHLIACHTGEILHGFMSFRNGYRTPELETYQPSNYISTIIVAPGSRRHGYARRMYERILSELPPDIESPYVTTRTWSTNHSHLSLLDDLGFEEVKTLPDDRGDGIHTVYYAIER